MDTCSLYIFAFQFILSILFTHAILNLLQARVAERHFLDLRKKYGSVLAVDLVNKVHIFFSVPYFCGIPHGIYYTIHHQLMNTIPAFTHCVKSQ